MHGLRRSQRQCAASCGALDYGKSTVINIDAIVAAHERTPLLRDAVQDYGKLGYGSQAFREHENGKADNVACSHTDDSSCIDSNASITSSSYKNNKPVPPPCVNLRLTAFLMLLIAGFVIATYLLIMESRLPVMRFSLDLVHHDIWSNMAVPFAGLLNYSNVLNIVIMQTGGKSCDKTEICMEILRELQMQYLNFSETAVNEVPYNFLIGGDGQTYEARGWNYESGNALVPQNTSLVIGFIGNYTLIEPSATQLRSALSLITESIRRKKLQRQYKIYGVRNLTISPNDGEALFSNVQRWPQFVSLVQVL